MVSNEVTIEGLPYSFPKSHVHKLVRPDEGHLYVRLHPPGEKFDLLHGLRNDRKRKEQNIPIVSTINSSRFAKTWTVQTDIGDVICKDVPHFNCGFELYDQDLHWSVVFDKDQMPRVSEIKHTAVKLLSSYRGKYADGLRSRNSVTVTELTNDRPAFPTSHSA